MLRPILAASLLLVGLGAARAQRLVTQTAPLVPGQVVVLNLRYAHAIRVRPGAALAVQARVTINGNQQNDAYSLGLEKSATEVRLLETLDEEKLRQTYYEGSCERGNFHSGSDAVNNGYAAPPRPAQLSQGQYNYCVNIDYEVTLPAATPLRLETISGDLDASDLTGPLTAETIGGNVLLHHLAGPVEVSSVGGSLTLQNLTGTVEAKTVGGDVQVTQPGDQSVQATSVSGNVDLAWPAARRAELSLHTTSGEVYADPAVTFTNLKPHSNVGYELHGSYGGSGGPLVKLQSTSGDVFFRPAK